MKRYLLLLLYTQLFFSQKTYVFDYAIEFDTKIQLQNNDSTSVVLINSSNNHFNLFLFEKNSINYGLQFTDRNGISILTTIKKERLKNDSITISNCNDLLGYSNPFKYQVKNYEFENLKDTLINDTLFYHCVLKSNRSIQYQKRKNIHSLHYIIDKETPLYLPYLHLATAYEEWKKEKNIPNGKLKMMYYVNTENEITQKFIVKKYIKVDKKLIIPKECTY